MKSEPSKWLPIVLSLSAIGISGFSWWEAHRGRLINEEINRPVLEAAKGVRFNMFRGDPAEVNIVVPIRNVGKTTAIMNLLLFESGLTSESLDCTYSKVKDEDTADFSGDILPGSEGWVRKRVSLSQCQNPSKLEFWLSLKLTYTDPISGKTYSQKLYENATWENASALTR